MNWKPPYLTFPAEEDMSHVADVPETSGNWINADDYRRNVRALDVALNGEEGAAQRPALIDILSQVEALSRKLGRPVLADVPEPKSDVLSMDDDGDVSLDWHNDAGIFSMSLAPSGRLAYAWRSASASGSGTVSIAPEAFPILLQAIADVPKQPRRSIFDPGEFVPRGPVNDLPAV